MNVSVCRMLSVLSLLFSLLFAVKETDLTEEQLKELAKLQAQKAQLERLLEQQRRVSACNSFVSATAYVHQVINVVG